MLACLAASPAEAVVRQLVQASAESFTCNKSSDADIIDAADPDGIDRNIFARAVQPAQLAEASAGVFGAIGLEVEAFQGGVVFARANIEASFINDAGVPARAVSQVVVDGATLTLLAAVGAKAAVDMDIFSVVGATETLVFDARLEVEAVEDFGAFTVTNVEDDLFQSRLDPNAALPTVVIDPFLLTLDLGVVGANEILTLKYGAVVAVDARFLDVEVGRVTFSDPLAVNITPPTFVAISAVPAPPAVFGALTAVGALGWIARRRRSISRRSGVHAGAWSRNR